MVIFTDHYAHMSRRVKRVYNDSSVYKLVYQYRKQYQPFEESCDVFFWQPKIFPRSISGLICMFQSERFQEMYDSIKQKNASLPRLEQNYFIKEAWMNVRGMENRFRRIDRRPPRVLLRFIFEQLTRSA